MGPQIPIEKRNDFLETFGISQEIGVPTARDQQSLSVLLCCPSEESIHVRCSNISICFTVDKQDRDGYIPNAILRSDAIHLGPQPAFDETKYGRGKNVSGDVFHHQEILCQGLGIGKG